VFDQDNGSHEDFMVLRVDFQDDVKDFFGDQIQVLFGMIGIPELDQLIDADSGSGLGGFVDAVFKDRWIMRESYMLRGRRGWRVFVILGTCLLRDRTHLNREGHGRMLAGQCWSGR
jgi:hypothetical protein